MDGSPVSQDEDGWNVHESAQERLLAASSAARGALVSSSLAPASSAPLHCATRPTLIPRLNGNAGTRRDTVHPPPAPTEQTCSTAGGARDHAGTLLEDRGAAWAKPRPVMVPKLSGPVGASRAVRQSEVAEKARAFEPVPPVAIPEPALKGGVEDEDDDQETEAGPWPPGPHASEPWSPLSLDALAAELRAHMQGIELRLASLHEGLGACVRASLGECVKDCRELLGAAHADGAPAATTTACIGAVAELKEVVAELRGWRARDDDGFLTPASRHRVAQPLAVSGGQIHASHGCVKVDFPEQMPASGGQDSSVESPRSPPHTWREAQEREAWDAAEVLEVDSARSEPSSVDLRRRLSQRSGLASRTRRACERLMRESLGAPDQHSVTYRLSQSKWFSRLSLLMTLANCVAIAVDTELATTSAFRWAQSGVREDETEAQRAFAAVQLLFLVWLFFEILVHLVGTRSAFFLGEDRQWNFVDCLILCATVWTTSATKVNGSFARAIRMARVSRAFRAVHFVQYFESLQRMVVSMSSVVVSLFWTACLFFITFYIVGIAMMEGVTVFLEEGAPPNPETWAVFAGSCDRADLVTTLQAYYGGVASTWVTLFRAISGADWGAFAAPMARMGWLWSVVWLLYVFCAVFGMLNVVIGTVVDIVRKPLPSDRALRLAAEQKEERLLAALLAAQLKKVGKDAEDKMSRKMLGHILEFPSVASRMHDFGIDLDHLEDVIQLIDIEGHGGITAKAAARRFLSLRGEAKSQDVARLGKQLHALKAEHASLAEAVHRSHDVVRKSLLNGGEVTVM